MHRPQWWKSWTATCRSHSDSKHIWNLVTRKNRHILVGNHYSSTMSSRIDIFGSPAKLNLQPNYSGIWHPLLFRKPKIYPITCHFEHREWSKVPYIAVGLEISKHNHNVRNWIMLPVSSEYAPLELKERLQAFLPNIKSNAITVSSDRWTDTQHTTFHVSKEAFFVMKMKFILRSRYIRNHVAWEKFTQSSIHSDLVTTARARHSHDNG